MTMPTRFAVWLRRNERNDRLSSTPAGHCRAGAKYARSDAVAGSKERLSGLRTEPIAGARWRRSPGDEFCGAGAVRAARLPACRAAALAGVGARLGKCIEQRPD